MAIVAANGASRTISNGRTKRTVIIADASTAADVVPAVSTRARGIYRGFLAFSATCKFELKSGGVALYYGAVLAGDVVRFDESDELFGKLSAAIQVETSAACVVDGMLEIS